MNDLRQAFERLAAGLQKPLYNAAVRLAGNTEDGLDMARETFVRAYALYIAGCRSVHFRSWLYQILLDIYRERQGPRTEEPAWLGNWQVGDEMTGSGAGPRRAEFFRRTEEGPVEQALLALPVELRTVLVLCDCEGFSYSQISRIVRCPVSVVAGRVYQARRMLRMAMRKQSSRPPIER